MPKATIIEQTVETLWRAPALHLSVLAYVKGVRSALHTITVEAAVDMFMEDYGLTVDNYDRDSAITAYYRAHKKLINHLKHSDNG